MITKWINDITGTYYDDYDEAREAVLKFMGYTDTLKNTLIEYINTHGESKVLNGLITPEIGQQIYEEVFQTAEENFLSDYLVEVETEDEEDENI